MFDRLRDGRLRAGETVATGGRGLGSSLASQYGLVRDGNLLFAVNAGDNTVSTKSGTTPTAAAQVSFSPDGRTLVVTHKGDQTIDTFAVRNGYAGAATAHHSAGATPYGFAFDRRGDAIVSEAGPSAVSSYAG